MTLSDHDAQLLESYAAGLRKLQGFANLLPGLVTGDDAYKQTAMEAFRLYEGEVAKTISELGAVYAFFGERLRPLVTSAVLVKAGNRPEAVADLRRQVQDDLDTIARWKAKPWTAPGFLVADLKCDDRVTFYTRSGDWFAQGAVGLLCLMLLDWLLRRFLQPKPAGDKATEGVAP